MKFARTYSAPGDPYAGIEFEPRTSRIVNPLAARERAPTQSLVPGHVGLY